MSAAEVHVYDGLISVVAAEEALQAGSLSPEQVGQAVAATTDSRLAGQVAAARAKLEQARRAKGF